jgi:hypothetical protein
MKIDSDVKIQLMPIEGEKTEGYIVRLKELQLAATLQLTDAQQQVLEARTDLYETRRRGAHPAECREVLDTIAKLSRAVGKARYEKESVEFALSEVFHAVND